MRSEDAGRSPPGMRVLLVTEEMPERQDTGASVYLRHFVEYCAARRVELALLVTGHRFKRLIFRPRKIFPHARILGPDLIRVGPWSIVIDPRSWRHALFSWILRDGPGWLGASALRLRSTIRGHTAILGRWLTATEARRFAATIRGVDPDIMLVNTIFATAILDAKPPRTRAAVITHDVFHLRTSAFEERGLTLQPAVTRVQESELLRRFDAIIAISQEDAAELERLAPEKPTVVVMPPTPARSTLPRRPDPSRCLFLGTSSALNVDGIRWFLSAVWPIVTAAAPGARLELIGGICNTVAGNDPTLIKRFIVDDLGPALAAVSFAVNPLRAGSGVKIKMLDYFAYGAPAITTTVGAAGFPRNGLEPFVVCDDAVNFAETVLRWLRDPALVEQHAARCSAYVELCSQYASFAVLDRALGLHAKSLR